MHALLCVLGPIKKVSAVSKKSYPEKMVEVGPKKGQKFQVKGIVQLEPLCDKTYIRLSRNDFSFVGKKRQRKFIKHHSGKKKQEQEDYEGIMYS